MDHKKGKKEDKTVSIHQGNVDKPETLVKETSKGATRLTKDVGHKDAKSMISTSSRRSERLVLEVQLKKLEAEQALMEEEMKRKRELLEKKYSILGKIAENESNQSGSISVADPAEKVASC